MEYLEVLVHAVESGKVKRREDILARHKHQNNGGMVGMMGREDNKKVVPTRMRLLLRKGRRQGFSF